MDKGCPVQEKELLLNLMLKAGTRRKESKAYQISLEDLITSSTRK